MFVKLGQRGTVTIPKELRSGLDEGVLLEAIRREDGVIELRPQRVIDASQAWFWTERWQRMEQEAEADFAAGRFQTFDDAESFLNDLEATSAPDSPVVDSE
jgi:bifunctional DNA-binding transcriptional regulator/antitoxin component of YhaV-PrlF toxin-antitoxin module